MNTKQAALARKQLERRLAPLREMKLVPPPKGWIKAIRESLGMTARQLASRMDIGFSRIPVIEGAEVTGSTTLRTLRQDVARLDHTMRLKNQSLLKSDLDAEQRRAIDIILSGLLRGLWDEDPDHNARDHHARSPV